MKALFQWLAEFFKKKEEPIILVKPVTKPLPTFSKKQEDGNEPGRLKVYELPMGRPIEGGADGEYPFLAWGGSWGYRFDENGNWVQGQLDGMGQHAGLDLFGPRDPETGKPTPLPVGTKLYAPLDMEIVLAGWQKNGDGTPGKYGLRIVGFTREKFQTSTGLSRCFVTLAHLSDIHVKPLDSVRKGDLICLSGNSGNTGKNKIPHCHAQAEENTPAPRRPMRIRWL